MEASIRRARVVLETGHRETAQSGVVLILRGLERSTLDTVILASPAFRGGVSICPPFGIQHSVLSTQTIVIPSGVPCRRAARAQSRDLQLLFRGLKAGDKGKNKRSLDLLSALRALSVARDDNVLNLASSQKLTDDRRRRRYFDVSLSKTTSRVMRPLATASCLPSRDQAKSKMWSALKSVANFGGPPLSGCSQIFVTPCSSSAV